MRFSALGLFVATVASVASFGGGAVGAPVPKHLMKGEEPDLLAMQGQWKFARLTSRSQVLQNASAELDLVLEVREGTLFLVSEKQNRRTAAAIKIDARANPPRMTWSEGKVTNLKGKAVEGSSTQKPSELIYKLEGDTLVLATNIGARAHPPKGFDGKDDESVAIMTFTRVKK